MGEFDASCIFSSSDNEKELNGNASSLVRLLRDPGVTPIGLCEIQTGLAGVTGGRRGKAEERRSRDGDEEVMHRSGDGRL